MQEVAAVVRIFESAIARVGVQQNSYGTATTPMTGVIFSPQVARTREREREMSCPSEHICLGIK